MSVWSSPCYGIEPLRNAANCMPRSSLDVFPEELAGIADFDFGDCAERHPERAGRNAAAFYRENPSEWKKFFLAGRANLQGTEAVLFSNTLRRANVKLGGIRAVYWAFAKFRNGDWEASKKLEAEALVKASSTIFNLGAAPSRIHQPTWDAYKAFVEEGATNEGGWAKAEEIADGVRYLWTLKSSSKQRKIKDKAKTMYAKLLNTRFRNIKTREDAEDECAIKRGKFTVKDHKAELKLIDKKIKAGETLSRAETNKVAILPYKAVPYATSKLVVFSYKGGLILYDAVECRGALITQKDYDRLVQMLQSDAKLKMYYSKYDEFNPSLSRIMISKYEEIMGMVTKRMRYMSADDANKLCRVFDVCQFLFLANMAADVSTEAIECQTNKLIDEKLVDLVDVERYMAIIDDDALGIKESLELAKFCKIFPCPDFCIYSVVDGVANKSKKAHKASEHEILHSSLGTTTTVTDQEFHLYCMRNRAITFHAVHGFLPGTLKDVSGETIPDNMLSYPNVSISSIKPSDMAFVDMRGAFDYRHYAGCEIELVKDKVVTPTMLHSDANGREPKDYPKNEKNQVLKYLFDEKFMPQEEVAAKAVDGTLFTQYDQMITLALKPEAKKPGSRPFSMATDELRRLLSEAEANVATYVTRQKGSSQGKSTMDLDERMAILAATPEYNSRTSTYMMSFDLEGFSPMQDPRFKERAMRSWSECFDTPEFDATLRIFSETTLLFDKFGLSDTFKMVGNDLEGFHGRLNTAAHIDLMGYAVFKLKELGLSEGAAGLEVLIDDGLLRIAIKKSEDHAYLREAVEIIDIIYKFSGQKISWDKTFVSQSMCQYLNRVYYDGIEVTPGAKAFLRIGKNQECAIPTIADEMMAHAATTRGAIQSGAHHMLAYYAYCVEQYKTLKRWGLKHEDDSALSMISFALFVPIGLGGFGMSTLFGLSTNESLSALQSGIAAMKLIVRRFPGYAHFANTILNAGVRPMTAEGILRNPMAIRTNLRCLNVRRFANVAKAFILRNSTNALIIEANRGTFDGLDEAIMMTISADSDISEVKRKYLWDMTISSYLDTVVGKLQSSSTASALIGAKRAIVIYAANRGEARMLINEMATGNLSVRSS
jgi:hypothetical protein